MKKMIGVLSVLLLYGCFWGPEAMQKHRLTGDLWLYWWGDEQRTELVYSYDEACKMYSTLVPSVVFAAGANTDFVILKRHPNRIEQVEEHLWGSWDEKGWKIADEHIGDTIFFGRRSAPDSIYRIEGQWYHRVGGWTPPDSIRNPYRRITRYYILDLRTFRNHARGAREGTMEWLETLQDFVYEYASEDAYAQARQRLGVPDSLDFSVRIERME